ncbi:MAG: LysR family transcriptional regulator [Pseudomonadota bacterium]
MLRYFVAVASRGSIRRAAETLSVGSPVVSASIKALEQRLGVSLMTRNTRRIALTDAGRKVLAHAEAMLAAADAAFAIGQTDSARASGPLSLTLPSELAAYWLPPQLDRFLERYPNVRPFVSADDRIVDLNSSPFDLALRGVSNAGDEPIENLVNHVPLRLVAAPGSLAEKIAREWTQDGLVTALPFIASGPRHKPLTARTPDHDAPPITIPHDAPFQVDNQLVARALAVRGIGAALLLQPTVEEALSDGSLVQLLPHLDFGHVGLRAVARDPLPSVSTRMFINFLTQQT